MRPTVGHDEAEAVDKHEVMSRSLGSGGLEVRPADAA